jgi:hypothetical protein
MSAAVGIDSRLCTSCACGRSIARCTTALACCSFSCSMLLVLSLWCGLLGCTGRIVVVTACHVTRVTLVTQTEPCNMTRLNDAVAYMQWYTVLCTLLVSESAASTAAAVSYTGPCSTLLLLVGTHSTDKTSHDFTEFLNKYNQQELEHCNVAREGVHSGRHWQPARPGQCG